jgi:hypothetical protein
MMTSQLITTCVVHSSRLAGWSCLNVGRCYAPSLACVDLGHRELLQAGVQTPTHCSRCWCQQ